MLLTFHQAQLSGDGVTYEVIDTGYTCDGDDLAVYGAGPQTTNAPTLPAVTTLIDCPASTSRNGRGQHYRQSLLCRPRGP